jgi:N-acetylneuraminate lyase
MKHTPLRGLVAAAHTPFDSNGALKLSAVEKQAAHYLVHDIRCAFIGGSTGESHSLAYQERRDLAAHWMDVSKDSELEVVVHVGSNCLTEATELARQAGTLGVRAISMLAPSYFKPKSVENLAACCAQVAAAAPETPFYYYDIPALTGVQLPMPKFIEIASEKIPTFAGVKYTNFDLGEFQLCRALPGDHDLLWGVDEFYLAALALGAEGGIGSTYNFAPQLAHRIANCFNSGDLEGARKAQLQLVQLIQVLVKYSYLPAAKALMAMLGVDIGPARLPYETLTPEQSIQLRADLEGLGFFSWIAK